MKRLAVLAILVTVLVGCDGLDPEEPWSGEPDRFEPDDARTTAREQRVDASTVTHTFVPEGDVDWVRFRVTAPDVDPEDALEPAYSLWLQSIQGSPSAQLWREDGLSPDPVNGLFNTPGVYFVRLDEVSDAKGECGIWISLHRGGEALPDVAATTVTVDPESAAGEQTITVRLANQGGAEALFINCTAYVSADRVLDIPGDESIGTAAEISSLLDNRYVAGTGYVGFVDVSINVDFLPVTAGPWYVLVEADVASVESDTTNNVGVASTLVNVTEGDARDLVTPDDTIVAADGKATLSPGGLISDLTLWPAGDVDIIKLDIPDEAYCYEIETRNIRGAANTVIEIVDENDVPIDYADAGGQETGGCYLWIDGGAAGLTVGTSYYVRVTGTEDMTGAYDISLRAGPIPAFSETPVDYSSTLGYEPDDVFEPALGIAAWRAIFPDGNEMTRAFSGDGTDVDYLVYSVKAADDGTAREITVTGDGIDVQATLLDYKGGTYSAGHVGGSSNIWIVDANTDAGLYYLKIENLSGVPGTYTVLVPVATL